MVLSFILSIAVAFVISFLLTPAVRNLFVSRGWIEDPREKQIKTQNATSTRPVPRGGGLPIFTAIILTSFLFLPVDKHLLAIFISGSLTLIIGLWDDVKDISPKIRLFTNLIAGIIIVASGIGIAYVSHPLGGVIDLSSFQFNFDFFGPRSLWVISDLLAIIWIIWCMNVIGWAGGVEGQLPGFVSVSAIFVGILGLKFSGDTTQWPVIILAGTIAGAYLGFLPFNFYPQSIMIGYSGKSLAGLMLAILSILSGAKLATITLLLAMPMIDAFFVLFRRLYQRRPLLLSDGQHLHHILLKNGWSRPQISIFYWSLSLLMGVATLFLNTQQKLILFALFFVFFVWFLIRESRRT